MWFRFDGPKFSGGTNRDWGKCVTRMDKEERKHPLTTGGVPSDDRNGGMSLRCGQKERRRGVRATGP